MLVFLQPDLATSHKRRTSWEARVRYEPRMGFCLASLADRVLADGGAAFVDLRRMFDADTAEIFNDIMGHVPEDGNARIAAIMADRLIPPLRRDTRPR